tara:strand:+ start:18361 stop:19149 length:789 start_codon:yes stop_codon:yes gene_type:complete
MLLFVFVFFFLFSCSSESVPSSEVVARVNKSILTKEALSRLVGGGFSDSRALRHATNTWVEKKLLHGAAVSLGLKKDKKLKRQRDLFYEDLLVSSYVQVKTKSRAPVLKKEISAYYNKNKNGFTRTSEEVVVKHFLASTRKEANNIKRVLKKNKGGKKTEQIIKKYKPKTRALSASLKKDNLVGFVFNAGVGDVVGPKENKGLYHVFQIIKKHKEGSLRGLELVYDEIQQRISKQKELEVLGDVLDSLYINSDVFISQEVFK